MLIEEENFRNLFGKHIIIKNEESAKNIAKTYEVVKIIEERGEFIGSMEDIKANEDANALLTIPYIDHTAGISFGILDVLHIDKNNHIDIIKKDPIVEEVGVSNVIRKEGLEDSEFIYLEEATNYGDLDLKKYANEENCYY